MIGWGADAVVTSGYKWLSAHGGVALLALVSDLVNRVPRLVGWMGAQNPFDLDPLTLRLADDARRLELSTMSYVSAIGLESSIAMLSSVGFERIDQHARRLATHLVDRVAELGWRPFRQPGDPSAAPHIVSLRHADHDPAVTAERLASEARIVSGRRADGLRISLHAYNDSEDVDRLVEALRRL
jgi:selenocysteine lyase/cysteine desulfurase